MVHDGYDVDVFVVAHFTLSPERAALIAKDPGSCPKCDVISIIAIVNMLIVFLFI